MIIEQSESELILKVSKDIDILALDRLTKYLQFLEITKDTKADNDAIDLLAKESKSRWWSENKSKHIH